jgi:hypothetical protein
MANGKPTNGKNHKKPNVLVIFGDDIGQTNISAYSRGMMGYTTPNIDRIAREGSIPVRPTRWPCWLVLSQPSMARH